MGSAQKCKELYGRNLRSNTPRKNSCSANYLPSLKRLSKTNEIGVTLLERPSQTHIFTFSNGALHMDVRGPTRTYVQQLYADTRCGLENLPWAMDDRDAWGERVREKVQTARLDDMYIYIYIYIYIWSAQWCIYIYIIICDSIHTYNYHYVVLLARISLTLSRHLSQSPIASGWSSRLHLVSMKSCCR